MWKKYRVLIIILVVIAIVFSAIVIAFSVFTSSQEYEKINNPFESMGVDNGYRIVEADYKIDVGDDRVALVTESITVAFYQTSHGIVRYLVTSKGEQYSDVTVTGDDYFVTAEGGFICVNTGKRYGGPTYSGGETKSYTITYRIVPPTNTARSTNYYMNVVPYGWSTSQENVSLSVTMPYTIKDVQLFAGEYGSSNTYSGSNLSVSDKVLTFSIAKLNPFQGVTVDIETGTRFSLPFSTGGLLALVFALIAIAAPLLIKNLTVSDRPVVEVVNAAPPSEDGHELDPAEMGFLIDGKCDVGDITAMIFYFASKGYLDIEDVDGDAVLIRKEIDPSAPQHQQTIYNGLFKSGPRVTAKQLKDKFYSTVDKASSQISSNYKKRLHESKTDRKSFLTMILSLASMLVLTIILGLRLNPSVISIFSLKNFLPMVVGMGVMFGFGRTMYDLKAKHEFGFYRNVIIAVFTVSAVAGFVLTLAFSFFGGFMPFYGGVACYAAAFMAAFVCGTTRKRTEYFAYTLGQIKGFKNFLTAVDKERMIALINENPQYYYNVLPYINVLGIDDKWADKFSAIKIPPALFYVNAGVDAGDVFDIIVFNRLVNNTFSSYKKAMSSRPQQKGGGKGIFGGKGGFGGGFGGGGFGGGGGGRR